MKNTLNLLPILGFGFLLSGLLLKGLLHSPWAKHFSDRPGHRKMHVVAVPRLGGVGIVLTFLMMLAIATPLGLWNPEPHFLRAIILTASFMLFAGIIDDVYSLGYKAKFLLQFLLAGTVVSVFHLQFEQFSLFGYVLPLKGMGAVLSMFWIVAVINAVNLIDGIDGLAAGVSLCGLAGIGFLAADPDVAKVCVALSGPILGFLYFNFHRRNKVFLGDTGSQFLGALLAVLILKLHGSSPSLYSPLLPVMLVIYPVLDTSVAMMRRFLKGRPSLEGRFTRMFTADNEHLHHRLVHRGLSHAQATFLLLLLSSGFVAAAVLISRVGWIWETAISAYLAFVIAVVLLRMGVLDLRLSSRLLAGRRLRRNRSASARAATTYFPPPKGERPMLEPARSMGMGRGARSGPAVEAVS